MKTSFVVEIRLVQKAVLIVPEMKCFVLFMVSTTNNQQQNETENIRQMS